MKRTLILLSFISIFLFSCTSQRSCYNSGIAGWSLPIIADVFINLEYRKSSNIVLPIEFIKNQN